MSFTDPLQLEYLDSAKFPQQFKLLAPFHYWVNNLNYIEVPVGFVTDMASVPRLLWNLCPPDGPWGKAAVIHDYLYRTGGRVIVKPSRIFTKPEADLVFHNAMLELGVPRWRAWVMYQAVRVFGRSSFKG